MSERTRRTGANEAIFRQVNEQIEDLNNRFGAVRDGLLHVVCECGSLECVEQFAVPLQAYEEVRRDGALFLIKPGHEIEDVEDVVGRAPDYFVVRKQAGAPEELARDANPRS